MAVRKQITRVLFGFGEVSAVRFFLLSLIMFKYTAIHEILVLCLIFGAQGRDLPLRRMRYIASTNGGSESFQPLADAFIALNKS